MELGIVNWFFQIDSLVLFNLQVSADTSSEQLPALHLELQTQLP